MIGSHYLKRQLLGGICALVLAGTAAAQSRDFDIAAGDLKGALDAYARQAGVQLIYDSDAIQGKRTAGVHGPLTPENALKALLAGTNLEVQRDVSGAVAIRAASHPKSANNAHASPKVSADSPTESPEPQEVMVTAQRRSELLQDVPVAVTALTAADLDNQRIADIQDVSRLTPGLTIASFSYSRPNIAIRGATNGITQIGVDSPVAVMVDDVFISRTAGDVFNLYDLDSVQVLRGPQGTLFGRNVTGGAILLTTSKPSYTDMRYSGELGFGNYDEVEANALVSGPIDDNMAAKLVASHTSHDGYGYDRLTGRPEDDLDSSNFRAQFRARAGDVDTLFTADYSMDDNGGRTLSSIGAGSVGDLRVSELGVDQFFKRHMGGLSNNTIWDVPGDNGTVTAITAYRVLDSHEVYSLAGASYQFLASGSQQVNDETVHVKDFSEEIRYSSPDWQFGNFIAGTYYLNNDAKEPLFSTSLAAKTGKLSASTAAYASVTTNSASGYMDGNINLPENFRLTLGGRYTYDAKTANLDYINALNAKASFDSGDLSRSWVQFTPRAVLSWNVSDENLLYASVTRGFTSGGYDTADTTRAALAQGFQPEKVTSYETGLKSSLFDRRITADLAVFEMDFKNKQEFVFNSVTGIGNILNAAQATSKGAELEVGLHPLGGLDINLSYAKLDTVYDNFVVPGVLNNTGHPTAYSPRNKASATLHYELPVGDLGFAIADASYTWTDSYYTSASTQIPQLAIPQYPLVDANVSYESPDRRYRVSLWGKNLLNKDYLLAAGNTGVFSQYLGAPRTFGGTVSVKF